MSEKPKLADYPRHAHDKLRYADTDRQGHVNNAVFATFFETGRVEFLYDPTAPLHAPDGAFVIARASRRSGVRRSGSNKLCSRTAATSLPPKA